jgi:CHAT domain-containing protein/tetratricopeptide (TPR) repeat protein
LTFFVRPQLVTQWWPGRSELVELVAAVGTERTIEPRLTGGFAYGPLVERSATRSGERGEDRLSPDLRIAALTLEKRLQGHREPSALAAYAAGQLVTGQTDRAVSAFEEAARLVPKNARFQNDLSAAYLVRFKQKQDLEDVSKAVAAATAATEMDPSFTEARFNLAIALESLSLRNEARKAWEAYLKIDSKSPWAQEAKRHLDALAPEKQSQHFEEEHRQVVEASARGDREAMLSVVRRLPDTAYDYAENELLPAWADAWLARDRARADDLVQRGRLVGDALASTVNERMILDAVAAIDRAIAAGSERANSLAQAHLHFRQARASYQRQINVTTGFGFADTREPLVQADSPLAEWVTLYLSAADYLKGDLAAAARPLDGLVTNARQRGHSKLEGRSLRLRGLIRGVRGSLADSLDDYQSALSIFDRILDRDEIASIHSSIAERLMTLGNHVNSQMHHMEALAGLNSVHLVNNRARILAGAANATRRWNMLAATLAIQGELLDNAETSDSALDVAQAYLGRATVHKMLGHDQAADQDVNSAARWVTRIRDTALGHRMTAEVDLAKGEVATTTAPARALESLGRSLAYFQHAGLNQRLPPIYLAQGRAEIAEGRPDKAEASFLQGIDLLEKQRARLPTGELRLAYFDLPWNLFDEEIELLASQPARTGEALAVAERVRARDLLEAATRGNSGVTEPPAALSSQMPSQTAMFYFVCLRDRLLTWIIRRGSVDLVQESVTSAGLARDATTMLRAVTEGNQEDFDRLSEHLFGALIEPLLSSVRAGDTLVFVPDAALSLVPFAALRNPRTGHYLIEDHALTIAPSATMFARASVRLQEFSSRADEVLVFANPQIDPGDATGLRNLAGAGEEAREIVHAYPRTVVLTGPSASKDRFLKNAGDFDIVHFAGHAIVNDTYPLMSRLVFARPAPGHSGLLFGNELLDTQFDRTSLVVLAACRTALGPLRKGEGPISLARPFLARGVPEVVASLWDVDDYASGMLFKAFYPALRSGFQPAEALRNAQVALLRNADPRLHAPSAWAAFSVTGGIRTDPGQSSPNGGRQ